MVHSILFHQGQPLSQVNLRLFGLVPLNSGHIDEILASCSYCKFYRHLLEISKNWFVLRSKSWSLSVVLQKQQAMASRLSTGRCVTREWVRSVLFFTGTSLNASHIPYYASCSSSTHRVSPGQHYKQHSICS